MNSQYKSLLAGLALVSAIACNKHKNANVPTPVDASRIVETQDPTKMAIKKILDTVGGDLCQAEKDGRIAVQPFRLNSKQIAEAFHDFDEPGWGLPKKITPAEQKQVNDLFIASPEKRLPFCFSPAALQGALSELKLPEGQLKKAIDDCDDKTHIPGTGAFANLEKGLRKKGYNVPLGVCIAHFGGDYDASRVSLSGKLPVVEPSCFSTVAAHGFGFPPNTSEPYTAYIKMEEAELKANEKCLREVIK